MPTIEVLSILITIIGNISIGLFTYRNNQKSATNITFFGFTISLSLYLVCNYLSLHQSTDASTLFWIHIVMAIAAVLNLMFFLLSASFPSVSFRIPSLYLIISTIFTIILALLAQTTFVFVSAKAYGVSATPGPGIIFFLLHTVILLGGGLFMLIRQYFRSSSIQKAQLRFFLIGIIVMFSAIVITNIIFVLLFKISSFVNLLPLYTLFFVVFSSYAIVKHRFLDIRLIVARSVSYLLLITILGMFYALNLFSIAKLITGQDQSITSIITSSVLALIIAFTFQPIRHMLEQITTRIFFKESYDTNHVLTRISRIMSSIPVLSELVDYILKELITNMKIGRSHVVLLRDSKLIWQKSSDEKLDHINPYSESEIVSVIEFISQGNKEKILIYEDVENPHIKDIMSKNNVTVVVPLISEGIIIGGLLLGEKQSGDLYSEQDINLLKIVSPEFAVSVKNALYYEEIKRFNITLKAEVKRETEKLQKANERLEGLDHAKDEFISIASHELRTPMTVIKTYLWMVINGKGGDISDKQKFYLERAYKSTDGLITLVNDMLNISRIESNRIVITPKPINLPAYITDLNIELLPRAQELGITLELTQKNDLPEVLADPDKLREVFVNLIGNALKFTPRDGKITITLEADTSFVTVHIKDTGTGIAKEDMPKLFTKFGMVVGNYLTKQNSQGTGLGLYIAKSIVELHGGTITAFSEGKGQGTMFSFSLQINRPGVVFPKQEEQQEIKKSFHEDLQKMTEVKA